MDQEIITFRKRKMITYKELQQIALSKGYTLSFVTNRWNPREPNITYYIMPSEIGEVYHKLCCLDQLAYRKKFTTIGEIESFLEKEDNAKT